MHERDIVIITRISYVTRLRRRSTLQLRKLLTQIKPDTAVANSALVGRWLALIKVLLKTFKRNILKNIVLNYRLFNSNVKINFIITDGHYKTIRLIFNQYLPELPNLN